MRYASFLRNRALASGLCPARAALMMGMVLLVALVLSACEGMAPVRRSPEPATRGAPPPEPARAPVTTQVFVYPTAGQSPGQLSRDQYECYLWAVKQSGFDPSQTSLAPHQRVQVVPMPPSGTDTAAGAITGAVIGAVIAGPDDAAAGAVGGAIIGGVAGAASDAQRAERARQIQRDYDLREGARMAKLEEQANNYRRALTACLEGRRYTVK